MIWWNNFKFGVESAWQNFWRNATVSLAAVFVMTLLLIVMGMLVTLSTSVLQVSSYYLAKTDVVSLFIADNDSLATVDEMRYRLEQDPRVKSVSFTSKTQALRKFSSQPGTAQIIQDLEGNPLPASLDVAVRQTTDLQAIDAQARSWRTLDKDNPTGYQAKQVQRILSFFTVLDIALVSILIALTAVSVFIIMSTIRTAVYVRRAEIEVMKLVGASDWFVRWPFILEGILGGLMAAVVASLVIQLNRPLLDRAQAAVPYIPFNFSNSGQVTLALTLFGAGALLGAVGSYIGVRRFLRI